MYAIVFYFDALAIDLYFGVPAIEKFLKIIC